MLFALSIAKLLHQVYDALQIGREMSNKALKLFSAIRPNKILMIPPAWSEKALMSIRGFCLAMNK